MPKILTNNEIDQIRLLLSQFINVNNSADKSGQNSTGIDIDTTTFVATKFLKFDGLNIVGATSGEVAGGALAGWLQTKGIIPITSSAYDIGNPSFLYNNIYANTFRGNFIMSGAPNGLVPYTSSGLLTTSAGFQFNAFLQALTCPVIAVSANSLYISTLSQGIIFNGNQEFIAQPGATGNLGIYAGNTERIRIDTTNDAVNTAVGVWYNSSMRRMQVAVADYGDGVKNHVILT